MNEKDRAELQQVVEMLVNPVAAALNRIADAMDRQAEATVLLARATAGEFDDAGDEEPIEPTPSGRGMGMSG